MNYPVTMGRLPIALDLSEDGSVLAIDSSRILHFGGKDTTVLRYAADDHSARLVAGFRHGAIVATSTTLLLFNDISDSSGGVLLLGDNDIEMGASIRGLAAGANTVWIVVGHRTADHWRLIALRNVGHVDQTKERSTSAQLDGPVVLHELEHDQVVLAEVNPPYRVAIHSSDGTLNQRISPDTVALRQAVGDANDVFLRTLSVMPLDCGQILQVMADLRSDNRVFVVYDAVYEHHGPIRLVKVQQPIGLVASSPHRRLLLGAFDNGTQRKVALLGWE